MGNKDYRFEEFKGFERNLYGINRVGLKLWL